MIHAEAEAMLAAGAVLGDLTPEEQAEYDAHRATCIPCRTLEVELDHVLADLALAAPDRMPPPDLLDGIRAAIAADGGTSRAAASANPEASASPAEAHGRVTQPEPAAGGIVAFDAARSRRSQRLVVASLGLAAVFGIVAVGLGARAVGLQQELATATTQVEHLEATLASAGSAMTVAMNPSHVTVALHAEPVAPEAQAAVMFLPGSTASWIVAENLPPTPEGHGYQLWYADDSGVHGLQTVPFDGDGAFMAPIEADLGDAAAVMITLEPTGGATGEPGPQVVFGEL
jgi:hypothetical protein